MVNNTGPVISHHLKESNNCIKKNKNKLLSLESLIDVPKCGQLWDDHK